MSVLVSGSADRQKSHYSLRLQPEFNNFFIRFAQCHRHRRRRPRNSPLFARESFVSLSKWPPHVELAIGNKMPGDETKRIFSLHRIRKKKEKKSLFELWIADTNLFAIDATEWYKWMHCTNENEEIEKKRREINRSWKSIEEIYGELRVEYDLFSCMCLR